MNNEEKNEIKKTTDGEKKIVFSSNVLWSFLIISIMLFFLVGVLYFNHFCVDELNNFQPWVENLVGILLVFVGGVYVKTSYEKSRKGGTKYYPFKYRTPDLEKKMTEYCKNYTELQQAVAIGQIHQWVGSEATGDKYWKTVFYLQDVDNDFIKAWNDFNFYDNMKLKKESDLNYFLLVKKYVYLRVYEAYTKIAEEKCVL